MVWALACLCVETEMTGHRVASSECAAQHAAWPDCGWWFHAFPHPTPFQAAKPPIPYLRVYDVKSVRSILVTGVVRFPTQGKGWKQRYWPSSSQARALNCTSEVLDEEAPNSTGPFSIAGLL